MGVLRRAGHAAVAVVEEKDVLIGDAERLGGAAHLALAHLAQVVGRGVHPLSAISPTSPRVVIKMPDAMAAPHRFRQRAADALLIVRVGIAG